MNTTRIFAILALCAASLADSRPAGAQYFPLHTTPETGGWMETSYTGFSSEDVRGFTAVSFLSGRLPLNERFSAVADVPFSQARSVSSVLIGGTSRRIGNPYVGMEITASERLMLELGMRAPLSTADPYSILDGLAARTDRMRPEAHVSNVVPVSAAAMLRQTLPGGLALRARGGVTRMLPTGNGTGKSETALDYGLGSSYTAGSAQLGLGVVGRWWATAPDNANETNFHQATLSADVEVGRLRPGASVRIPLDRNTRTLFDPTIGVHLQVPLR